MEIMFKKYRWVRIRRLAALLPLLVGVLAPAFPALTERASAANFSMKTGYYVGTGADLTISNLGFQPEYILIKISSSASASFIKTKDMAGDLVMSAATSGALSGMTITSTGFSLSATAQINEANGYYYYIAFAGSDCTSSGTVCVSSYTGDGSGTRAINTGFQPSLIVAKNNSTNAMHFKTATMPSANTEFFSINAANTSSAFIGAISSDGFSVGSSDNTSAAVYYYIAFKEVAGLMKQGSYTGNGVDSRDITGLGFKPNAVFVKNSTSAINASRRAAWSSPDHHGDLSSYIGDVIATGVNIVQKLDTDGFQVGNLANSNESGATIYWFAFGGEMPTNTPGGSFEMKVGTYVGTGSAQAIGGIGFSPDLVIIKDNATNLAAYRTAMTPGDATSYIAVNTADFTGGITSLGADEFNLGTSTVTNAVGQTYQWQAFGNAYNPYTGTGSTDFAIGAFQGNGIDDRDITGVPFQPDLVFARRVSGAHIALRTSAYSGDLSGGLGSGIGDSSNAIQEFSTNGFQVGTGATVNTANTITRWFSFKVGSNFSVGSYTGNGIVDREIGAVGFQPDLVWVKSSGINAGVHRSSSLVGDVSQSFNAAANPTGTIKSFSIGGFTVGSNASVNANSTTYRYAAWRIPASTGALTAGVVDSSGDDVSSPNLGLSSVGFLYGCGSSSGVIGESSQRIRVSNTTSSPGWSLSIAASGSQSALWANGGNTIQYDYNDPTSSGCGDGADSDSKAGMMSINADIGTLSPQSGCSSANITKGSLSSFSEGSVDAITLLNASPSANTSCYWDLTGVGLEQIIPAEQASETYNINLTITITAS